MVFGLSLIYCCAIDSQDTETHHKILKIQKTHHEISKRVVFTSVEISSGETALSFTLTIVKNWSQEGINRPENKPVSGWGLRVLLIFFIEAAITMAGANTTQFMNQKLQEETPIFSKVSPIS